MRRRAWAGMIIGMAVMAAPPAWAMRLPIHDKAESPVYKEKLVGMLGRGALNLTTGFVDVLTHTVNQSKQGPPVLGTLEGVAEGLGCGLLRTGSGLVDLITCWVPGYNGAPVSSSYDNCLVSEYPGSR